MKDNITLLAMNMAISYDEAEEMVNTLANKKGINQDEACSELMADVMCWYFYILHKLQEEN